MNLQPVADFERRRVSDALFFEELCIRIVCSDQQQLFAPRLARSARYIGMAAVEENIDAATGKVRNAIRHDGFHLVL